MTKNYSGRIVADCGCEIIISPEGLLTTYSHCYKHSRQKKNAD